MKNKRLIIIGLIFLAFIIVAAVLIPSLMPEDRLTEEEIAQRRENNNYRIRKFDTSFYATIDFAEVTFRERVERTDTFAYCETIKDKEYIELEPGGLISKNSEMRIHTARVIKDSEGLFKEGDVIVFAYGLMPQSYCPQPKVGDKMIIPVNFLFINDVEEVWNTSSGNDGYYYVTEDGYCIAAFEEEEGFVYSGKTVDNLLKALKKTDEERESYLSPYRERYENTDGKFGFDSIEMLKKQIREKLYNE